MEDLKPDEGDEIKKEFRKDFEVKFVVPSRILKKIHADFNIKVLGVINSCHLYETRDSFITKRLCSLRKHLRIYNPEVFNEDNRKRLMGIYRIIKETHNKTFPALHLVEQVDDYVCIAFEVVPTTTLFSTLQARFNSSLTHFVVEKCCTVWFLNIISLLRDLAADNIYLTHLSPLTNIGFTDSEKLIFTDLAHAQLCVDESKGVWAKTFDVPLLPMGISAPELKSGPVSLRDDLSNEDCFVMAGIYAASAILYFGLTGMYPVHKDKEPLAFPHATREITPPLKKMLASNLSLECFDRPNSYDELLQMNALQGHTKSTSIISMKQLRQNYADLIEEIRAPLFVNTPDWLDKPILPVTKRILCRRPSKSQDGEVPSQGSWMKMMGQPAVSGGGVLRGMEGVEGNSSHDSVSLDILQTLRRYSLSYD